VKNIQMLLLALTFSIWGVVCIGTEVKQDLNITKKALLLRDELG
jgi:hypothetical protein